MAGPDRYALFGHPVSHSRSPEIQHAFAAQTGEALHYELIDATPESFEAELRRFFHDGGSGGNVTLPLKLQAFDFADHVSSDAWRAGAVNTLSLLEDGSLFGDNTDGTGLIRDITVNHGVEIEGRRVLLLGAGGAARGAAGPLLDEGPAELVIANRHPGKALLLAQLFAETGNACGMSLASVRGAFDLVVNATSASLRNAVPDIATECVANAFAYDMVYADEATSFLRWAKEHGATHATDGWGMLVEQAAESFFVWKGVRPATTGLLKRAADVQSSGPAAR